ncbi:MAG: ribosomal protein L16 Arg81 hydroxylase [Granulosicoccus sp.]|jgi:ribosomal protein L16 Arg81 hydroxylase
MDTASKIALVLGPVTESEFFENYWEQHPLHVSRSSKEHFASLTSIDTIESVLSVQALFYPSIQLTQLDQAIEVSEYTDAARRILPHRLIERHHEGATIVISQAHEKIPSLADFRRDIQNELNLRCQTNVYLSPKGKQGFNAHFDSHDVFILQVAGTKTFNFYEGGVELPYQQDGFQAGKHTVGVLSQSIALEPGDTLYIPRGVMHDAVATEQTSLHITLGVYAITLRDVLIQMTQQLTDKDPEYRKSVPRNLQVLLHNDDLPLTDELQQCLKPVLTSAGLISALSSIEDTAAINSAPNCEGMLSASPTRGTLNKTIQIDPSQLISVERSGEVIRLRTHAQVLEFINPLRAAIEQLLSAKKLEMSNFEGLDDDQKQTLYTRLQCANLLMEE